MDVDTAASEKAERKRKKKEEKTGQTCSSR